MFHFNWWPSKLDLLPLNSMKEKTNWKLSSLASETLKVRSHKRFSHFQSVSLQCPKGIVEFSLKLLFYFPLPSLSLSVFRITWRHARKRSELNFYFGEASEDGRRISRITEQLSSSDRAAAAFLRFQKPLRWGLFPFRSLWALHKCLLTSRRTFFQVERLLRKQHYKQSSWRYERPFKS